MGPYTEALVAADRDGTLFAYVDDSLSSDYEAKDILAEELIVLHNDGSISLTRIGDTQSFAERPLFNFFGAQNLVCKIIPRLRASVEEMMQLVNKLVAKGGNDGAATRPNGAFREWLQEDNARATEVVTLARQGNDDALQLLTFALEVIGDVGLACTFLCETGAKQTSAAIALGRIAYTSPKAAVHALNALCDAREANQEDTFGATLLSSCLAISQKHDLMRHEYVMRLLRGVVQRPGPHVVHACAQALWLHESNLTDEQIAELFSGLLQLDPSHMGTVRELDHGLSLLLQRPEVDVTLEFLGQLLARCDGALKMSALQSTTNQIPKLPKSAFDRLVVSWFLGGHLACCLALTDLLRGEPKEPVRLSLDLAPLGLTSNQLIFIARKAVGFLFLSPVTATSILISTLRVANEDTHEELLDLLYHLLLLNYPVTIRAELDQLSASDPINALVKTCLEQLEAYDSALESAKPIRELHPSTHDRQTQRLRALDDNREIQKKAHEQSIFLSLIHRMTVLYGRRTLSYVEEHEGILRPVAMELHPYSVELELPRGEILDPLYLDFIIRVLKTEKLKP